MISGRVRTREPRIRLTIVGYRGQSLEFEAVVDTGNTGALTLPATVIAKLKLHWHSIGRAILADGSERFFDVYKAKVIWHGRPRSILVDEFDATPLVGMTLLAGSELTVQVRSRGKVTIKRL